MSYPFKARIQRTKSALHLWLDNGVQSFRIATLAKHEDEHARWFAKQLRKAIKSAREHARKNK